MQYKKKQRRNNMDRYVTCLSFLRNIYSMNKENFI